MKCLSWFNQKYFHFRKFKKSIGIFDAMNPRKGLRYCPKKAARLGKGKNFLQSIATLSKQFQNQKVTIKDTNAIHLKIF